MRGRVSDDGSLTKYTYVGFRSIEVCNCHAVTADVETARNL